MLLEQIYITLLYIVFIEFAIVTFVAIALLVALIATTIKYDNKKNTSLSGR